MKTRDTAPVEGVGFRPVDGVLRLAADYLCLMLSCAGYERICLCLFLRQRPQAEILQNFSGSGTVRAAMAFIWEKFSCNIGCAQILTLGLNKKRSKNSNCPLLLFPFFCFPSVQDDGSRGHHDGDRRDMIPATNA
ncbi:hypothetical protein [Pannonibacter phragmitetus]|uniref:hypothetical protein n=1 Tax=Pannonibacter phragmitetus TaxID=121719 RepID=UPI0011C034D8|nr:hypothetical protein [Pannonibacter phragmitetus]